MSPVFIYATSPTTDVVHMTREGIFAADNMPITLCGRIIGTTWSIGDETVSGIAATCRSCFAIARPDRVTS